MRTLTAWSDGEGCFVFRPPAELVSVGAAILSCTGRRQFSSTPSPFRLAADRCRLRARSLIDAVSTPSPGVLGESNSPGFAVGRHGKVKSPHGTRSGLARARPTGVRTRDTGVARTPSLCTASRPGRVHIGNRTAGRRQLRFPFKSKKSFAFY
ncbi:Uncharacterized protein FWK35_00037864 [Aphis craccivora]|uniref:Uncharacterized protein n=1 Tax=Aphis craccivora TaxID=307492 RepID=A0A6G0Y052_APHCR|nr:Uncharacterized protein FWK35_00037864 [Aphis craccivora]